MDKFANNLSVTGIKPGLDIVVPLFNNFISTFVKFSAALSPFLTF